ncbi:phosphoribosylanthranilate isomerase [Paenibacillus sp. IITD108]|uniref:phosphoribosylanthranilate isomerase n=1 Tax=Paenibacillus sp. IITD108 TaxID=3116649 RepID=UPI002F41278D
MANQLNRNQEIHNTRIKICGFKEREHIAQLQGLPIHEVGFVFAPSKRQVNAQQAAELVAELKNIRAAEGKPPRAVGVFVNFDIGDILAITEIAPLDVLQLHGDETPDYCKRLKSRLPQIHIWKVFSVRSETDYNEALSALQPFSGCIDAILLDAPGGGTGQVFQWSAIEAYQAAAASCNLPLYAAGGLNESNVQQLLQKYKVDGIDVSSGVEAEGRKSVNKIEMFVRRVREA